MCMKKGIILFDIKNFLYQGQNKSVLNLLEIDRGQVSSLNIMHEGLRYERDRRLSFNSEIPVVETFIPTGDGYFLITEPKLDSILDISLCVMGLFKAYDINIYLTAHIGNIYSFTDLTGSQNATGFEIGYVHRLQSVSKVEGKLTCSKQLKELWEENEYFQCPGQISMSEGKDGINYEWCVAEPKNIESSCSKFKMLELSKSRTENSDEILNN